MRLSPVCNLLLEVWILATRFGTFPSFSILF
jgi:hypothetical protein